MTVPTTFAPPPRKVPRRGGADRRARARGGRPCRASASTLAGELSLGEQRRLEIARALARSPHLVLMDEPTAGLNPEETDALVELIADTVLPAAGLILIEHKPDVIAALCPMAILLDRGRATAAAPPAELFASDTFRRAYLGVIDREGGARPCG